MIVLFIHLIFGNICSLNDKEQKTIKTGLQEGNA